MDIQEFRIRGKEMVEYICEFMSNIHNRRVTPDVGPGYLRPLLPSEAPQQPEPWEDIMRDVESKIMPGVSEKEKLHLSPLILLNNQKKKRIKCNKLDKKEKNICIYIYRLPIGNIRDFTRISQPEIPFHRFLVTCYRMQ